MDPRVREDDISEKWREVQKQAEPEKLKYEKQYQFRVTQWEGWQYKELFYGKQVQELS
ncbi:MAG: hypothetical protein ABIJ45_09025 [Candidatus Zixiibacteriota bacterium]